MSLQGISNAVKHFTTETVPNAVKYTAHGVSCVAGRVWTFANEAVLPVIKSVAQSVATIFANAATRLRNSPDARFGAAVGVAGTLVVVGLAYALAKLRDRPAPVATAATPPPATSTPPVITANPSVVVATPWRPVGASHPSCPAGPPEEHNRSASYSAAATGHTHPRATVVDAHTQPSLVEGTTWRPVDDSQPSRPAGPPEEHDN